MRTVKKIRKPYNLAVLVRASLNVPIENNEVRNTFRLRQAIPTIEYLRSRGARVVLIGHIGEAGTETLEPVARAMREFLPRVSFCPVSVGAEAKKAVESLLPGDVLMLENLRRHKGEMLNDPEFAREIASLGDVFVEDAFDVCHRAHASVVSVPSLLPSYAGLLVEKEIQELSKALSPRRPALAIIGGAKFSTKEPVLAKLVTRYDHVFVGGALANDFMQAEGLSVGKSFVSGADRESVSRLAKNPRIVLPADVVVAPPGSSVSEGRVVPRTDVLDSDAILDDGPQTVRALGALAKKAKTILWNGPLGNYEHGFTEGTEQLLREIAVSKARSIIGGGDTVAAIEKLNVAHRITFVSTGGGAMLDFLAKGTLPGIEVLGR